LMWTQHSALLRVQMAGYPWLSSIEVVPRRAERVCRGQKRIVVELVHSRSPARRFRCVDGRGTGPRREPGWEQAFVTAKEVASWVLIRQIGSPDAEERDLERRTSLAGEVGVFVPVGSSRIAPW